MSENWTPGPWTAYDYTYKPDGCWLISTESSHPTRSVVLAMVQLCQGGQEGLANIRLMVSALELLEALKASALAIHADHQGYLFTYCQNEHCIRNRKVILAATGHARGEAG